RKQNYPVACAEPFGKLRTGVVEGVKMILGEKPSCSTGEFGFNPMACQAVANLMRKLYADRWER
ncbi:MAG: hypothetical protein VST66_04320, partial [Nitrospirota bacterium]|nr:hypothetical protein [Nitrospirota bacterium]